MKQFNLFNKKKQKVSVILADNAFDYNVTNNIAAQITCLLKLSYYFFRRSFLKKGNVKDDGADYNLQIYLKGLYSVGDDYNNIRIYYCWRLVKDNVVIATGEPDIRKISNLNAERDIVDTRPEAYENAYAEGVEKDIPVLKKPFTAETDRRWIKRVGDIASTAPIPEDDIKLEPIDDINNVKKNILIAIYNAAREYYRALWDEGEDNRAKMREKFNIEFAGFAKINEDFTLSPIDEIFLLEKRALIHQNREESFEILIDELLQRCAGNRYAGEAYRYLAIHLNQLNHKADYFNKIEPIYGDVVNSVPLVSMVLDLATAPTNLVGITAKRKDFEFKPRISGRVAPIAPPIPPKVTNPFEPNFEQLSEPPSPLPERSEDPELRRAVLDGSPERRPARKGPATRRGSETKSTPVHLQPSRQITRVERSAPRFPDKAQRRVPTTAVASTHNQSFGARHPIWMKALIGGAIGLAVAIVLAIAIGFIMFPPGAAVTLTVVTAVAATSKAGMLAAILAGVVIAGTVIGAGIGASVGASAESKKQKRIAATIKEQDKKSTTQVVTAITKRHREITRFTSEKKRESISDDIPLTDTKTADKKEASPPLERKKTPTSVPTLQPSQPVLAPVTKAPVAKTPLVTKEVSSPAIAPQSSSSLANLRKVGGYIPVIGGFIDPPQSIPTIEDFKNRLLVHYGAATFKINYEYVMGTRKTSDEAHLKNIASAHQAISTWKNNPGTFKFLFSIPMVKGNPSIKAAYIAVMNDPAFKAFDFEQLQNDDNKFMYDSVMHVQDEMIANRAQTLN